jgi:hypothetical protein
MGAVIYNAVQALKNGTVEYFTQLLTLSTVFKFDLLCEPARGEYLLSTDINHVKVPPNLGTILLEDTI